MPGEGNLDNIVLLDSCVVIDYIKGIEEVKSHIVQIRKPCINFVIEMELFQGAKDKRELLKIEKELNSFNRLAFHNEIAKLSIRLLRDYFLSHSLKIADSIIAATCLVYNIPLFTYNRKDFRFIPDLCLYETSIPKRSEGKNR